MNPSDTESVKAPVQHTTAVTESHKVTTKRGPACSAAKQPNRVPWYIHLRRAFKKTSHLDSNPWHTHCYRAVLSFLGDTRYKPTKPKENKEQKEPQKPNPTGKELRQLTIDTARAHLAIRLKNEAALRPRQSATDQNNKPNRVFIDVTYTARHNLRTGIQRVVRNLARECLHLSSAKCQFIAVEIWNGQLFASSVDRMNKGEVSEPLTPPLKPEVGDFFLVLDSGWGCLDLYPPVFEQLNAQGVRIISIIYDLIPIRNLKYFSNMPELTCGFSRWLGLLAAYSEQIIGISKSCIEDASDYINSLKIPTKPNYGFFHLGVDETEISPHAITPSGYFSKKPINVLMVGTLEPRKGYDITLAAFDHIFRQRNDVALHIIGRYGWNVEDTLKKIQQHPLLNQSLFWHGPAVDALLAEAYKECDLLIAASYAEGFGLPLVEAAQHDLAIVASDLPVFKEVAGEAAYFFPAGDTRALTHTMFQALKDIDEEKVKSSREITVLSWKDSALMLTRAMSVRRDDH